MKGSKQPKKVLGIYWSVIGDGAYQLTTADPPHLNHWFSYQHRVTGSPVTRICGLNECSSCPFCSKQKKNFPTETRNFASSFSVNSWQACHNSYHRIHPDDKITIIPNPKLSAFWGDSLPTHHFFGDLASWGLHKLIPPRSSPSHSMEGTWNCSMRQASVPNVRSCTKRRSKLSISTSLDVVGNPSCWNSLNNKNGYIRCIYI